MANGICRIWYINVANGILHTVYLTQHITYGGTDMYVHTDTVNPEQPMRDETNSVQQYLDNPAKQKCPLDPT